MENLTAKRIEGKIIKIIIGFGKSCKSTDLLQALEIEYKNIRLNLLKCDLYKILSKHTYTKSIIKHYRTRKNSQSDANDKDQIHNQISNQILTLLD